MPWPLAGGSPGWPAQLPHQIGVHNDDLDHNAFLLAPVPGFVLERVVKKEGPALTPRLCLIPHTYTCAMAAVARGDRNKEPRVELELAVGHAVVGSQVSAWPQRRVAQAKHQPRRSLRG